MSALLERVRCDAQLLAPDERRVLAIELIEADWDQLDSADAVEVAWDSEIATRVSEIDAGQVELVSWVTARERLVSEFGWDK